MYSGNCVQASGNVQSELKCSLFCISLYQLSHHSYLITHIINPGYTWTAASNAAHTA